MSQIVGSDSEVLLLFNLNRYKNYCKMVTTKIAEIVVSFFSVQGALKVS